MQSVSQLLLRISIGIAYFIYGTDRLGLWGKYGDNNVSWGDWQHFVMYARKVMSFLPESVVPFFAFAATVSEISLGLLLVVGFKTRIVAAGSAILSALFAISMTISFGFLSPLSYGVFTVCTSSLLLFSIQNYRYSIDSLFHDRKIM